MIDNKQSITTNSKVTPGDRPLLEHSNVRNATQASMRAQTRLSSLLDVDFNQLNRMVNHLEEQIEYFQRQHDTHLNFENAINKTYVVAPQKGLMDEERTSHSEEKHHSQKSNKTASTYYLGMPKDVGYKPINHHHDALLMERILKLEQSIQMDEENNPRSNNNRV